MLHDGSKISDMNLSVAAPSFGRVEIKFQSVGASISPGPPQKFPMVQKTNSTSGSVLRES